MRRSFQNRRRAFRRCSPAIHGEFCLLSHSSALKRPEPLIAPTVERQKRVESANFLLVKQVGWALVTLGRIGYEGRNSLWRADERWLKDLSDWRGRRR